MNDNFLWNSTKKRTKIIGQVKWAGSKLDWSFSAHKWLIIILNVEEHLVWDYNLNIISCFILGFKSELNMCFFLPFQKSIGNLLIE